jgi:hypothetical protein
LPDSAPANTTDHLIPGSAAVSHLPGYQLEKPLTRAGYLMRKNQKQLIIFNQHHRHPNGRIAIIDITTYF